MCAGTGLTVVVLVSARLSSYPVTCAAAITIFTGAGAVSSGVAFTWIAWQSVAVLTAREFSDAKLVRLLAILTSASVGVTVIASGVALLLVVTRSESLIDGPMCGSRCTSTMLMAAILLLAITNFDALQLIAWRQSELSGFPTTASLALSAFGVLLGDSLQIGVQAYFIAFAWSSFGDAARETMPYALSVSVVCLVFAVASLWSRGLRKLIIAAVARRPTSPRVGDPYWSTHKTAEWFDATLGTMQRPPMEPSSPTGCVSMALAQLSTPSSTPQAAEVRSAPRNAAMRWLTEVVEEPDSGMYKGGIGVHGELPTLWYAPSPAAASHDAHNDTASHGDDQWRVVG